MPELSDRKDQLIREMDAIIDSVQDGIYVTDGDGRTLRVNRAFERLSGLKADDLVGRTVQSLVESGVYDRSVSREVLESGRAASMMETLPNGREVLLTGIPVRDEEDRVFRVVTTLRDVQELNALKEELALSEKSRERYRRELLQLRRREPEDDMVVSSSRTEELLLLAGRVARVDSTVLITGESGVGKELIARAIHRGGRQERGPMVTASCGAIPEALLESELFGYEKGAFTGADRAGKPGLIELAEGGTLFLDEVGELSLSLQVKILRVLQEKEIMRVGGRRPRRVDVRIIAATNRNLKQMVKRGTFRQDLYYRLNVVPINVPPLRERREEILPLVRHFLALYNRRFDKDAELSSAALKRMESYHWPGNVRELENTVERLVVLVAGRPAGEADLPDVVHGEAEADGGRMPFMPLEQGVAWAERQLLREARRRCGSTRRMAAALGVSQSTVVRRLEKYGID